MSRKSVNRRIKESDFVLPAFGHRLAAPLGILLLLSALGLYVVDRIFQPGAFPVKQVTWKGQFELTNHEQLVKKISSHVHGNVLALDLHKIEEVVKSVNWIDDVSVRRGWPDAIQISVIEHVPVARWGNGGWVTKSGTVVADPNALVPDRLPIFDGPAEGHNEILRRYRDWGSILLPVGLMIEEIELTERGAWKVRVKVTDEGVFRPVDSLLDTGVANLSPEPVLFNLQIGRRSADERIARFSRVYRDSLLSKVTLVKHVDLRHTNGFSVKWIEMDEPETEIRGNDPDRSKEA